MKTASRVKIVRQLGVIVVFFFTAVHCAVAQTQFLNFMADSYGAGGTNGQIFPSSMAAADINGDGSVDLLCANGGDQSLSIFTNNGHGYFFSNALISLSANAQSVVATDVNGDGWPDLVVANNNDPGTLTIFTNNGGGVFSSNATLSTGYDPNYVVAADLNGDGKMDLICINGGSSLTVFLNNGGGIFTSKATLNAGGYPTSLIAADFNGDGKVGVVAVNEYSGSLAIFTNDGAGNLTSNSTVQVNGLPSSVAAVDIYGSGKLALITANSATINYSSGNTLTVFTNNGSAGFSSNATIFTGPSPAVVIATNVSGNALQDLVCVNAGAAAGVVTVFTNDGSGVFGSNTYVNVGTGPVCLLAADVNNDGKMDLISGGGGGFTVVTQIGFTGWMYSSPNASDSVAIVDANKNGLPDLVTANTLTRGSTGDTLTVYTNNGAGLFGVNTNLNVGSLPAFLTTADINGDGWPDLISGNNGGSISVLTNNRQGGFATSETIALGSSSIAPIDVNGEIGLGIVSGSELLLYTNNGTGFVGSNALLTLGKLPDYTVAADVNNDGLDDLICSYKLNPIQSDPNGTLVVLLNDGKGGFVSNALYQVVGPSPDEVIAQDINGDGHVDLLTLCESQNAVVVFTNTGSGGFVSNATYSVGNLTYSIAMADINGDGSPDLICAGNGSPPMVNLFTNNGAGVFGFYADFAVNLYSTAAIFVTAGDLNGDGKPDFVLTTSDGSMTVFLNTISFPAQPAGPVLKVSWSGVNVVLSWSSSATNLVVETNSNLNSSNWAVAPYSILTTGANHSVTISPSSTALFFRLFQQ
jgi:hypothetical protein